MASSQPLLDTIEPDEPSVPLGNISSTQNYKPRDPVVLTPTNRATQQNNGLATNPSDAESGIAGIFRQSSHPLSLFFLFVFRLAAVLVYILSGFFTSNYVLSTVMVVVLLAVDFWTCRNVSGRTLVGLRFWNQVDDDGVSTVPPVLQSGEAYMAAQESYWVFESRDVRLVLGISGLASLTHIAYSLQDQQILLIQGLSICICCLYNPTQPH